MKRIEDLLMSCPMDTLCSEFGGSEQLLVELREKFEDWLKLQPHLPKDIPIYLLNHCIIHTKFSLERAKQKLDMYYTVRSLVPEYFRGRDPEGLCIERLHENVQLIPLPKLTPENYRVFICRFIQKDHENFYLSDFYKYFFMLSDVLLTTSNITGGVGIYDYANMTMGHMTKFPPTLIKKAEVIVRKAYAVPVKGLHFINVSSFMMHLINTFKTVLSPKIASRIHVHSSGYDSLTEFVPKSVLPKDYGGDEISMDELANLWREEVLRWKNWFLEQENVLVDESRRPGPMVNGDDFFGFSGSFRKLDVD